MYTAKVISPKGEEVFIEASTEWQLHRKVQEHVGKINTSKFTTKSLKGGHTLIQGGGWRIVLYCSGK